MLITLCWFRGGIVCGECCLSPATLVNCLDQGFRTPPPTSFKKQTPNISRMFYTFVAYVAMFYHFPRRVLIALVRLTKLYRAIFLILGISRALVSRGLKRVFVSREVGFC